MPELKPFFRLGSLVLLLVLTGGAAMADPWARSGDPAMRHDLRLLADAGVVRAPVNAWPIPWAALAADLDTDTRFDADPQLAVDPAVLAARARVATRLNEVRGLTGLQPNARLAVRTKEFWLRGFEDTPREENEIRAGVSWMGVRFAARLQLSRTADPLPGDNKWRGDGSYLAGVLGNHIIYGGALDHWWGPGHADSLVLSPNARPVSGFGAQRSVARPFANDLLSRLGPWTYSFLWGFLESDRELPDARMMAFRLGVRPTSGLELGLSRAALWCGRGESCGTSAAWDVVTASGEGADQFTALDFRWQSPLSQGRWAVYGQAVAQDRDLGVSSRWFGQLGLETWGSIETRALSGSWRGWLEYSNSTVQPWRSDPRYDRAYNTPPHDSGHRHRWRSLGAAFDGDGEVLNAGVGLVDAEGRNWNLGLRYGTLNKRGDGLGDDLLHTVAPEETRVFGAQLTHRRDISIGNLKLGTVSAGVGVQYADNRVTGGSDTDPQVFLQWTWDYSGL